MPRGRPPGKKDAYTRTRRTATESEKRKRAESKEKDDAAGKKKTRQILVALLARGSATASSSVASSASPASTSASSASAVRFLEERGGAHIERRDAAQAEELTVPTAPTTASPVAGAADTPGGEPDEPADDDDGEPEANAFFDAVAQPDVVAELDEDEQLTVATVGDGVQ